MIPKTVAKKFDEELEHFDTVQQTLGSLWIVIHLKPLATDTCTKKYTPTAPHFCSASCCCSSQRSDLGHSTAFPGQGDRYADILVCTSTHAHVKDIL